MYGEDILLLDTWYFYLLGNEVVDFFEWKYKIWQLHYAFPDYIYRWVKIYI